MQKQKKAQNQPKHKLKSLTTGDPNYHKHRFLNNFSSDIFTVVGRSTSMSAPCIQIREGGRPSTTFSMPLAMSNAG